MKAFLFFALLCFVSASYYEHPDRVPVDSSYLFQKGEFTTGRRSPGIPQIQCISGDCSKAKELSQVLCTRIGGSAENPIWNCEALHSDIIFTTANVYCEGYWDRNDPFILRNSCGVEFGVPSAGWSFTIFWILCLLVLGCFVVVLVQSYTHSAHSANVETGRPVRSSGSSGRNSRGREGGESGETTDQPGAPPPAFAPERQPEVVVVREKVVDRGSSSFWDYLMWDSLFGGRRQDVHHHHYGAGSSGWGRSSIWGSGGSSSATSRVPSTSSTSGGVAGTKRR